MGGKPASRGGGLRLGLRLGSLRRGFLDQRLVPVGLALAASRSEQRSSSRSWQFEFRPGKH